MKQQLKLLLVARHRVKYGLDYFLDYFLNHFMDQIFLDHFIGGEAHHYYSGRGGMQSISTEGGVEENIENLKYRVYNPSSTVELWCAF